MRIAILEKDPKLVARITSVLGSRPGFEVGAVFECWHDAAISPETQKSDIVLADYDTVCECADCSEDERVATVRRIVHDNPSLSLVFFAAGGGERFVINSIKFGAKGILVRDGRAAGLLQGLEEVWRGGFHISPALSRDVFSALGTLAAGGEHLPKRGRPTKGELQCIKMISGGKSRRETAKELGLSENTVQTHLLNLYRKLGVKGRDAAVRALTRQGLMI